MSLSTSRAVCALAFLLSSAMTPSVLAHAHLKQQSPAADTGGGSAGSYAEFFRGH
jgi:methionine-rich copper-binding protein CopC